MAWASWDKKRQVWIYQHGKDESTGLGDWYKGQRNTKAQRHKFRRIWVWSVITWPEIRKWGGELVLGDRWGGKFWMFWAWNDDNTSRSMYYKLWQKGWLWKCRFGDYYKCIYLQSENEQESSIKRADQRTRIDTWGCPQLRSMIWERSHWKMKGRSREREIRH